ncbi:MAG: hypothetical protein BYD32DRAFT_192372 [Podila humilis]|nr:MAG: hypothetical protein BYD32DRAFT_192372 [Podila humilis]
MRHSKSSLFLPPLLLLFLLFLLLTPLLLGLRHACSFVFSLSSYAIWSSWLPIPIQSFSLHNIVSNSLPICTHRKTRALMSPFIPWVLPSFFFFFFHLTLDSLFLSLFFFFILLDPNPTQPSHTYLTFFSHQSPDH